MAGRTATEWFDTFTEARLPCAPINDVRGGIEFAQRLGLEPVVDVGTGDQTLPGVRNPISFSQTPASYDLVPPGIDADRVGEQGSRTAVLAINPPAGKAAGEIIEDEDTNETVERIIAWLDQRKLI